MRLQINRTGWAINFIILMVPLFYLMGCAIQNKNIETQENLSDEISIITETNKQTYLYTRIDPDGRFIIVPFIPQQFERILQQKLVVNDKEVWSSGYLGRNFPLEFYISPNRKATLVYDSHSYRHPYKIIHHEPVDVVYLLLPKEFYKRDKFPLNFVKWNEDSKGLTLKTPDWNYLYDGNNKKFENVTWYADVNTGDIRYVSGKITKVEKPEYICK